VCVQRASTGLCGGCRAIGIPTATAAGNGGHSQGTPTAHRALLYSDIDGFGVNQLSGKDSYGTLPSGLRLAFSGVLSSRSNCSRRSLSLTSSARSSTRCNVRRRRHIAVLHPLHADLMVLLVRRNLLKTRHKNL